MIIKEASRFHIMTKRRGDGGIASPSLFSFLVSSHPIIFIMFRFHLIHQGNSTYFASGSYGSLMRHLIIIIIIITIIAIIVIIIIIFTYFVSLLGLRLSTENILKAVF